MLLRHTSALPGFTACPPPCTLLAGSAPERTRTGKLECLVVHERLRRHPDAPKRPPKRVGVGYMTFTAGFVRPDFEVNDIVEVQDPDPPHDCRFHKPRFSPAIVDHVHPDRGVTAVLEGLASNRGVEELWLDSCEAARGPAPPLVASSTCLLPRPNHQHAPNRWHSRRCAGRCPAVPRGQHAPAHA